VTPTERGDCDSRIQGSLHKRAAVFTTAAVIVGGIATNVTGRTTGTRGVLPFGFSRQAVLDAFFLAQPFAERHRILPANADDRMIVGLIEARSHCQARKAL